MHLPTKHSSIGEPGKLSCPGGAGSSAVLGDIASARYLIKA